MNRELDVGWVHFAYYFSGPSSRIHSRFSVSHASLFYPQMVYETPFERAFYEIPSKFDPPCQNPHASNRDFIFYLIESPADPSLTLLTHFVEIVKSF